MSKFSTVKIGIFASLLTLFFPLAALAAPATFADLVYLLISFINPLAAILSMIAILIFFWGIVQYIYSAGGEGHERGRQLIVWGIIALFVLFSVWSLASILISTFFGGGVGNTYVPGSNSSYTGGSGRPYLYQ